MRAAKLGIACLTVLATALPAFAATSLTPDQIKAQFGTGKPFHGVAVPGGRQYSLTLGADGKAEMSFLNDKSTTNGTWHVSKTGYCSMWGSKPERCYTVQQNGKSYDVLNGSGTVIAHWTKA
jgi:hypothetical protein